MERKEIIKKLRSVGYGMLIALTLLAVIIPFDILTGHYICAFNCVLWIYVGIRAFVWHEKAVENANIALKTIEVQSKLIEVLRQVIIEISTRRLKTDEEREKES